VIAALVLAALLATPGAVRAADLLGEAGHSDETAEAMVRRVLVHRVEDDPDALDADIADIERLDHERAAAGLAPSGLADDARYLAAGLVRTRDLQREALHDVLHAHPDPMIRRLTEHRLEADDAATADQLLADDRHNRRAAVINDAVRPFGVFSGAAFAAAINPFLLAGSAVDSVATTAVNLWHYNRLSTPEREALGRYRSTLVRDPQTEDAPEIAAAIRRLGRKRTQLVCEETVRLSERALDADDVDAALFYARSADRLDGCDDKAEKPLAKAVEAGTQRAAREEAARWPADEPLQPAPGSEALDYEEVLVVTAAADPGGMSEAANRFRTRHPDSDLDGAVAYTVAVSRDLAGHREAARSTLHDLADDNSGAGRRAKALLASPDFNRLDALDDAERRHSRAQVRYVLLGQPDGRSALYAAANAGTNATGAAQSFGIVNVIGLLTRAWQTWRKDPTSNQAIIDRGEELLAREPDSPDAPAVHARLADAYERAQMYGRALMHLHATPNPSEKRLAKLQDKLADQLLDEAKRRDNDPVLLSTIVTHFSTTKAADKARGLLKDRPDAGTTKVTRDVLRAHPELLATDALGLDPRLLDGDRGNGELAEAGVTLADGTVRVSLESPDGDHVETHTLTPEAFARAQSAVQEALYTDLVTAEKRDPETGRYERYVPVFLQGSLGADGVSVYPGIKMRRYNSPDSSLYE